MHAYRTHNCAALTESDVGQVVRLSGWIHRKRDHGQLVFIDLRDHFGLTQCVVDSSDVGFALVEATRLESVVTCLLYTSPSPRDATLSRMPSSA